MTRLSLSANLEEIGESIIRLAESNPRRAARLRLDYLDVSVENQAHRLSDTDFVAELQRIGREAERASSTPM